MTVTNKGGRTPFIYTKYVVIKI